MANLISSIPSLNSPTLDYVEAHPRYCTILPVNILVYEYDLSGLCL